MDGDARGRREMKTGVERVGPIALGVCLLVAASTQAAAQEVSFTKDVAPILQRSCQTCHRPGSIAPMSLITYEDARPWARAIRTQVTKRAMPPWFVDKNVGIQQFKDDQSLSDGEIATIAAWVDAGSPRGNPADMPPPRTFTDNQIAWMVERELRREPDLVVPIPKPFTVKAGSPNMWLDFVSEMNLTEDRWLQAYETKPSVEGFPVVHHATTSIILPTGEENGFSEYALGKTGDIHPAGAGMLLKAGSKIRWNMHYSANPNGKDSTDHTRLAFWFYPKGFQPKYTLVRKSVAHVTDLDFPPGETNIRTDGYMVFNDNVRITVFQPHMHNLGKRQCLEVIYPDGRAQMLNCINWDFGWHIAYNYAEDAQPLLPKGTILHLISYHDNSTANKWAADPKNWVGWGNRSTDDMSLAHVSWYALGDAEYEQQVKDRLARRATGTNNNQ
jgi:hypothetical protein